ncbi:MAG: leucine-rich repeat protein, partial [Clostridia bacterium]
MAEKHWVCSNCGSISSRAISGGVVCAKCGANFPNVAENADITNQLTKLINTGKTEQIGIFRKNLRKELGNQLVNLADVLAWCDKLKEIYPEDYLAGFYTAFFKDAVGNNEYKNYLKDFDCRIVYEPNVFLKEAMAFAIKHVDVTTAGLTNGFIEKICEQVNSHLVEGETKLNCEDFKKQVNGRLEQLETEMDLFADIERKVFICYVSEDLTIAKEVYKYLTEGENISCFLSDYNLPKTWTINNADYWERIKSQIKQANVFLVISSNLLEHKINNGALKEIAFAKTQAHLARLEYKVDNSTENLCEKRTQNLISFFDGKTWIKREGKDNGLRTLALAVSSALEASRHATNTEKRNTKPQSTTKENVVKAEAVATMQPTNIAKPTVSANSAQQESKSSTHLEIPYGTTEIGNEEYKDNFIITSVNIPASVTYIGLEAFSSCWSLTSINVAEGNKNYKAINGNLYSKDGTTLVQYANGKPETSFTIPASVTYIDFGAVSYCKSLTRVTIPNSVTEIGCGAFEGCEALTSITIPTSVIAIDPSA